jgi:hypothetical protein
MADTSRLRRATSVALRTKRWKEDAAAALRTPCCAIRILLVAGRLGLRIHPKYRFVEGSVDTEDSVCDHACCQQARDAEPWRHASGPGQQQGAYNGESEVDGSDTKEADGVDAGAGSLEDVLVPAQPC